jgi:DNA-binding GntR family transcriptional regulator
MSLGTQAVENLRQAIIDGHFAPGARLTERELCEVLGVSRTIVRESLRQLEAEGWVENVPYCGPIVSQMSADEAQQLYEIRAALEGWAAKKCAERATDAQLAELGKLTEQMAKVEKKGDVQGLIEIIEEFHSKLLLSAGNPMLSEYLLSLRSRMLQLRRISLTQNGRARHSVDEKRALFTALKSRDGDRARTARETHVLKAGKAVVAAIENQLHQAEPTRSGNRKRATK